MIRYQNHTMSTSVLGLFFLFVIALSTATDQEAKLRFYFGLFDKYTEFSIQDGHQILHTSWYNSTRTTVIYCYGFTGSPNGPAVKEVIKAYLRGGESNVALLNWEHLASAPMPSLANSYANWAAPNARQLGVRLVETFLKLSAAGLDLNKTHLVGHSLGAQIWGIAGNNMKDHGVELPWITGLDPAAVGFEKKTPSQRLNPFSAAYVEIIHTDPSKYGLKSSEGFVDFWPNFRHFGPVRQPGCTNEPSPVFSVKDLCNHNRAWKLWVDSIDYPGRLIGSWAKNYKIWKNYGSSERNSVTLRIGEYNRKARSGNYYLVTNPESPFGLGSRGL